jgi:hypothetical protein
VRTTAGLRHIRVGAAHQNKPVRLLVAGAQVRIVTDSVPVSLRRDRDRAPCRGSAGDRPANTKRLSRLAGGVHNLYGWGHHPLRVS